MSRNTVMKGLALCTGLMLATTASAAETPSKYVKVYRGDEGLRVTTVTLEGADQGKGLISVSGMANRFDGLVFKATVNSDDRSESWVITVEGKDWHLLRADTRYGGKQYTAYLGDKRDGNPVAYDEKESAKAKPAQLVAAWGKMAKDARYLKVITFDRKAKEAEITKQLAGTADATAKACGGKPLAITIDWKTVTDDHIKRLSLESFCGGPAHALERICSDDEKLKGKSATLTGLRCQFGADMMMRFGADGVIAWTTKEEASNQEDFARAVIENELRGR